MRRACAVLVGLAAAFGVAAPVALGHPEREQGIRLAIRLTARTSALLFCLAFSASASYRLFPNGITRWQRRNRRYLGLSFAASHAIHAAAITCLAVLHAPAFQEHVRARGIGGGAVAYGFIVLMTATSFDRTAALIGPRAWKILHTVGALFLWTAFFNAFFTRALHEPLYWLPVTVLSAAMALRIVVWLRTRRAAAGAN